MVSDLFVPNFIICSHTENFPCEKMSIVRLCHFVAKFTNINYVKSVILFFYFFHQFVIIINSRPPWLDWWTNECFKPHSLVLFEIATSCFFFLFSICFCSIHIFPLHPLFVLFSPLFGDECLFKILCLYLK